MKKWGAALLLSVILGIGGCGGEAPKPTKVPMPPVEKKAGGPVPSKVPAPPSAEVKAEPPPPVVSYNYNPKGKVNPVQTLVVEKPEAPGKAQGRGRDSARRDPLGEDRFGQAEARRGGVEHSGTKGDGGGLRRKGVYPD